jgi:DNA ligase-1
LGAVSRTHLPIGNTWTRKVIADQINWMRYLDGEMVVDEPISERILHRSQAALSAHLGKPKLFYYVFDYWGLPQSPFDTRTETARQIIEANQAEFNLRIDDEEVQRIVYLEQRMLNNLEELEAFEIEAVEAGYEGIMVRDPFAPYKEGRSTFKQHYLMKIKRWEDREAKVKGYEMLKHNKNEQTRDAFGYAKRSSHQANKVQADVIGALELEDELYGDFWCGSGLDDDTRAELTRMLAEGRLLGSTVTYKYVPYGVKEKPRFPIFRAVRYD